MGKLEFIEQGHVYRVDGVVYPSVTQVIQASFNSLSGVPEAILTQNANFGTAVHKAIELTCKGILEPKSLDKAILPYLNQWVKFCADFSYTSSNQEVRGYDKNLRVAYTIDHMGVLKHRLTQVDIKTGSPKPEDIIQSCAYGYLCRGFDLFLLYLKPDSYKAVQVKGQERKKGEQTFMACLNLWNFKKERGLL